MAEAVAKGDHLPPTKKMRTDDCSDAVDSTTDKSSDETEIDFSSLKDFKLLRVLNNNEENKSLSVEGRLQGRVGKVVIRMQKLPFNSDKLSEMFSGSTTLKMLFQNDIYYNLTALMPPELNDVKTTIIYPAEDKHILRFEKQSSSIINETAELYQEITLPYLNTTLSKQWIYNILEHKKEVDRIVFEDPDPECGFILLPDLKWTGQQVEDLYLQAIVCRRDIASLRDLRGCHIPLLKNVYEKGTAAIKEKYLIPAHKQRVYIHYHPSYYHLHVHFTAISFEAQGISAGKAHLLSTVISNLEICGDYYHRAVLPFIVRDHHPLIEKFGNKGYFSE